jgi:hypothetical protein
MHILGFYQSKDIISHPIECFKRAIQLQSNYHERDETDDTRKECFVKLGKD